MTRKLYRVQEGSQLSGVCAGLEASGRGGAKGWRALFVVGSLFYFVGVFIYIGMAISVPLVKKKRDAQRLTGTQEDPEVQGLEDQPDVHEVEEELTKLSSMKERGLISEDEHSALRKKVLGI